MIAEAVPAAAQRLSNVSDSPRLDAELLMAHALGCERSALRARGEEPVPASSRALFEELVARRGEGVPVAYLTGVREFWSLELEVTADVLVPRPETELLVEWGLELLSGRPSPRILDLGTGSGCIALAFARERPDAEVTAIDVSSGALDVAARNGRRHGLAVDFIRAGFSDFAAPHRFDLVVSNPPYVAAGDPHLASLRHEPGIALVSGGDGLDAIREIAVRAPELLAPGARILVEHGEQQGAAVRSLLADAGLGDVATRRDLAGHERATGGRR